MKRFLYLLIAGLMLVSVVGCSTKQAPAEKQETTKHETAAEEEQRFDIKEIVSDKGTTFAPDLTTTGTTSTEIPLKSNQVELCGKTYTMPVKMSELMNDGWALTSDHFKNEFKPKVTTSLASFSMKNEEGAVIELGEAYNDTDSVQKLEDCLITQFIVYRVNEDTTKVDFVFPGGIVKGSTAKDVTSIYGDPNNSELFTEYSYNLEEQLSYNKHKDSGMSFTYLFEEDGTLSYAKITASVD